MSVETRTRYWGSDTGIRLCFGGDLSKVVCYDAALVFVPSEDSTPERYLIVRADATEGGLEPSRGMHGATGERGRLTYTPKTLLGQRLWRIRTRIVASSEHLLGWEDIEREIDESRHRYDMIRT